MRGGALPALALFALALPSSVALVPLSPPVPLPDAADDAPEMTAPAPKLGPAGLRFPVGPDVGLRDVQLAWFDQAERSGLLPAGTTDALAAADADADTPFHWRWAASTGDLDGDAVPDLLVDVISIGEEITSQVRAESGTDGHELWAFHEGLLLGAFGRAGRPRLAPTDTFEATPDLDGDGVDDAVILTLGAAAQVPRLPVRTGAQAYLINGGLHAVSGRTGQALWTELLPGVVAYETWDPIAEVVLNFPSGWAFFEAPAGPRVLYKTTDLLFHRTCGPEYLLFGQCLLWVQDILITEHLVLLDARTQARVWTRDFNATDDPDHTVYTWLTGVADLGRGSDPDVVLDQYLVHRPQYSEVLVNPVTGDPLSRNGQGMRVVALNGANGKDYWNRTVFEEPPIRANLPVEEPFPVLVWTDALVLDDVTGDGAADPIALYLTVDSTSPGTVNGMFRTHFAPIDGASGRILWDVKYQGWGFASTLSTPGHHAGLVAIATLDLPTPPASQGKFPRKENHLAVLNVADGTPLWSQTDRFAQDSYLPYELGLAQVLHQLAPHDWDGDGIRDLVTPAQYVRPSGANQTLLATTTHTYQILSGANGTPLQRLTGWGPAGLIVPCGSLDGGLTVVSGHGRRVDTTRFDGATGAVRWRQPTYFDERPRPATAGVDLIYLGASCDGRHDRSLVSLNLLTQAIGRPNNGLETPNVVGIVGAAGALRWLDPPLAADVPLGSSLDVPRPVLATRAWWAEPGLLFLAPAAVLPGLGVGVALRVAANRRNGGNGGDAS